MIHLERSYSLPKKIKSIDDIQFNIKFEHTLLRSKSERNILDTVFDETKVENLFMVLLVKN